MVGAGAVRAGTCTRLVVVVVMGRQPPGTNWQPADKQVKQVRLRSQRKLLSRLQLSKTFPAKGVAILGWDRTCMHPALRT